MKILTEFEKRQIALYVVRHPAADAGVLGEEFGKAELYMAGVLRDLQDERILSKRTLIVNWSAIGLPLYYRFEVTLDQEAIKDKIQSDILNLNVDSPAAVVKCIRRLLAQEFSELIVVEAIDLRLTDGRLSLTARIDEMKNVLAFKEGLDGLVGILSVESISLFPLLDL